MNKKNKVFIATSIDGYIADKNGGLDWLNSVPNPNNDAMGYYDFTADIDALVMGRTTFETVCGFDVPWPYEKPVFVLSNSLSAIPESHADKAYLVKGKLTGVLEHIYNKGYYKLYIDGGATIRSFLRADLIDEMIITTIPIVLGGGTPLFAELPMALDFELLSAKTYLKQITQQHYKRKP